MKIRPRFWESYIRRCSKCGETRPGDTRKWRYRVCPVCLAEYTRRYRQANPDFVAEVNRRRRVHPDGETERACKTCGEIKPYPGDGRKWHGKQCGDCRHAYELIREKWPRRKVGAKRRQQRYYQTPKGKVAARRARQTESYKESQARHRKTEKYRKTTAIRNARPEVKEALLAAGRRWYRAHTDKVAEKRRRWFRENPDKARGYNHARRARQAAAYDDGSRLPLSEVVARQGGKCAGCGKRFTKSRYPTDDHIVALAAGGDNTAANQQALCKSCNSRKQVNHRDAQLGLI